jgi:ATP-dependent Clp protease ATP-binding subunit ClpA
MLTPPFCVRTLISGPPLPSCVSIVRALRHCTLVMGEVRQKFRPEFLNRLDDIILFHRLQRSDMGKIVDIQMHSTRSPCATASATRA